MKWQPALIGIVIGLAAAPSAGETQPTGRYEYLSDICYGLAICPNQMGIDTTPYLVWPKQEPGKPLKIKDTDYAKGLGMWPPCQMIVAIDGNYDTFEAEAGVQSKPYAGGTSTMQVQVDGETRFDGGTITENDAAKPVKVSLAGAKELRLICGGTAWTNWANARLRRSAGTTKKDDAPVDMAPFARVVTFDPARNHGFSGDCTQEGFPAGDVFLETDLSADKDGVHAAPVTKGLACIGLQWMEQRRLKQVGIQFADENTVPPAAEARVECWIGPRDYVNGESNWQGTWTPLKGRIVQRGDGWTLDCAEETRKIRWIMPATSPVRVRRLTAITYSNWDQADLLFQLEQPIANARGEIEMYNGELIEPTGPGSSVRCPWDLSQPLRLKVRYTRQRPWGSDRTVIRVKLPTGSFAVGVDDLLPDRFPLPPGPCPGINTPWKTVEDVVEDLHGYGCVYVKDYGFFAAQDPPKVDFEQYKKRIAGRKTVLEQVRTMPDQNYGRALEKTYDPRQSLSATVLSLAGGNRKFIVDRNGVIHYGPVTQYVAIESYPLQMSPRFGSGKDEGLTRSLDSDGWLPIPVTSVTESGITYSERAYVAPFGTDEESSGSPWLGRHALGVAEFTVENTQSAAATASLQLTFHWDVDTNAAKPAQLELKGRRVLVTRKGELIGVADLTEADGLTEEIREGTLTLSGTLAGKSRARCLVYLPGWEMKPEAEASFADATTLLEQTKADWQRVIGAGTQLDLPDLQVKNLILSSIVHCWLAARNRENGTIVEPWIAPNCYGALDSESQAITRGMDVWGQHDYATRSLEFWLGRCPAGFFVSGYTYGPGTGQFLWTLMDHYRLTRDRAWLRRFIPRITKVCQYIAGQIEKTKRLDGQGEKMPEYGLMTPGRGADWGHWGYLFKINGHCYAGLSKAARTLAEFDVPEAANWSKAAEQMRADIRRALAWTQARTPVVPLRNGTWVPGYSYEVYATGPAGQFFPNINVWLYDILLGPAHLGPQGVLDPLGKEMTWITDHFEDIQFLKGWEGATTHPDYLAQRYADPFNWGGSLKGQPYYLRHAEAFALRDDVKPFVRTYINTAVTSLNKENLTIWENSWGSAAWDKTHETGHFLYQSRIMLVMERGHELWLAPFVATDWLEDGKLISVAGAPTEFGQVSYRIESHVAQGYIAATIEPPARPAPRAIVLRLRHPDGKPMRTVTVNGQPHTVFDAESECVRIAPAGTATISVKAEY